MKCKLYETVMPPVPPGQIKRCWRGRKERDAEGFCVVVGFFVCFGGGVVSVVGGLVLFWVVLAFVCLLACLRCFIFFCGGGTTGLRGGYGRSGR